MSASASGPHKSGFTLLEVLIAITLFALVISSVYGAYRATFMTVNSTESSVNVAVAARIVLERMSEDLQMLYIGKGAYLKGRRGDIAGRRADTLSCLSSAHLLFHREERPAGLAALSYTVQETSSGRFDLYRSDVPLVIGSDSEAEPDSGEPLGRGLEELRITYVDANGTEYDEWESGSESELVTAENEKTGLRLPVLLRLQIRMADLSGETGSTLFRTAVALPELVPDLSDE